MALVLGGWGLHDLAARWVGVTRPCCYVKVGYMALLLGGWGLHGLGARWVGVTWHCF